jgi:hypothetical protein
MSELIVGTAEVDEVRHIAHLSEKQLEQLVAEAVAKAAGVDLAQPGTYVKTCYVSSSNTSRGPEYTARCEIVVDRRPQVMGLDGEAS